MSKQKMVFELNKKGVRHLLFCEKMKAGLQDVAHSIMPNGEDYDVENMPTRSIVIITTEEGWLDNTENNTLLKSMKTKKNAEYITTKDGKKYWRRKTTRKQK